MSYQRVIPRDLFNEAKLLKCLGQLALLIHDGVNTPRGLALDHENPEDGFQIDQEASTGALYCTNLECLYRQRVIGLRSPYNSKRPFPLLFILDEEEGEIFDDSGALSEEFRKALSAIAAE